MFVYWCLRNGGLWCVMMINDDQWWSWWCCCIFCDHHFLASSKNHIRDMKRSSNKVKPVYVHIAPGRKHIKLHQPIKQWNPSTHPWNSLLASLWLPFGSHFTYHSQSIAGSQWANIKERSSYIWSYFTKLQTPEIKKFGEDSVTLLIFLFGWS